MNVTKKDLVTAAKALNMILGLAPAIDTKAGVEELKTKLIEAGELLVPEDVLPEKVKAVLEELGVVIADPENQEWEDEEEGELPAEDNAEEADSEDEEDLDDSEDEEGAENGAEEDDEEEEIKPAKKAKKEKKVKKEKKEKEPKKAKDQEPAKKPVTKITKKSIVEQFIDSKKGGTVEQMAQKIVDAGIDPDYEKNLKIVKLWLSKMGFKVTKAAMEQNPIFKR